MDKALLVGINKYPAAPLNGCVNDISDMSLLLSQKFGFQPSSIRMLSDDRATTQAILDRLSWLVDGAKPGDRLFFHYSGHGAQMATRDHSGEIDGLDEVICPVDFDWTDTHVVRDKDFKRIFSGVPSGCEFIWVSDSCHSGDLLKEIPQPGCIFRTMPMPVDIQWRIYTAVNEKGMEPLTLEKSAASNNLALISGCKSNQTSSDAVFDGRANGALTYFLTNRLRQAGGDKKPLDELVQIVSKDLLDKKFKQEPGVEGLPEIIKKPFLSI